MEEQERVPSTLDAAPVIVVYVDEADAPEESARMSINRDLDADGEERVSGIVPDPDGEWVVASVGPSADHPGYVSVYLNNPSRPDLPD